MLSCLRKLTSGVNGSATGIEPVWPKGTPPDAGLQICLRHATNLETTVDRRVRFGEEGAVLTDDLIGDDTEDEDVPGKSES